MPTNKNAQLRYQVLDRCFGDFSRKYSFEDLLEKVNDALDEVNAEPVNTRQLRNDIKFMRSEAGFNVPVETYKFGEGNKCYYRYPSKKDSIYKNGLTVQESTDLRSMIDMLGRFRGIPANAWLEDVISNLECRFGIKAKAGNVVSFEQNEQLKGLEFLSDLIDAAIYHQPLEVVYRSFKGNELKTIFHPYHLKQYNNRWFVFGLDINKDYGNSVINKALDRIESIRKVDVAFIPNTTIDFKEYFKEVVGVTVKPEARIEDIILKFDKKRFPYIRTKPIHPQQEILDEENGLVRIHVRPNDELEALLFSFGPQVEVIAPEGYRKDFAKKIEENLKMYKSVQNVCTDEKELCGDN